MPWPSSPDYPPFRWAHLPLAPVVWQRSSSKVKTLRPSLQLLKKFCSCGPAPQGPLEEL